MTNPTHTYATAASIGPRFLAGGLMLGILAAWMHANHDPSPTGPVAIVTLAAAISLLWGGLRLRIADDAPVSAIRNSGKLALLGAVTLAGVAAWMASKYKLDALGEVLGLGLFAIIAAAAGLIYLIDESTAWQRVSSCRTPIGVVLSALGIASLAAFFYVTMVAQAGNNYIPEMVGLLLSGFFLFFGGLYLLTSSATPEDVSSLRTFLVVVGAVLGVILINVCVARAIVWRTELFGSGLAALAGGDAWRFWLVAYGLLAGMGLILASLGLSLSQVRESAGIRRSYFGFNAVVSAGLLFVILATINMLVYLKVPYNFNWTKTRGVSALSASTKNLLAGLEEPVQIYVLLNKHSAIGVDLSHFLANSRAFSNKLDYEWIDPEKQLDKYKSLATRFKELVPETIQDARDPAGRGVLIVLGALPEDVKAPTPHAFIPARNLYEQKGEAGKVTLSLKAEAEIMKEIAFLVNKSDKRKLYFLQGNDELDIFGNEVLRSRVNPSISLLKFGASKFVEKLKKDRFEVAAVSFSLPSPDDKKQNVLYLGGDGDAKTDIPEDCDTLIIAGPSLLIPQTGLDAIERYLDRGGKLVVFLEAFTDRSFSQWKTSGIETVLKKYGVNATNEVVLRFPQQREVQVFRNQVSDPSLILAETPEKSKSVLAKQFHDDPVYLWTARVVKPGMSTKYDVEPLLVVNPRAFAIWADDDPRAFGDLSRYVVELFRGRTLQARLAKEDLPVAVTVTESAGNKPRMVVFGDAEFISNEDIGLESTNYDLARSAIEWMGERGFIGPAPKETSTFSFTPRADLDSMVYGALWTMIVLIVLLGGGVWLIRRR